MRSTGTAVVTTLIALALAALAPAPASIAAETTELPLRLRANGGHSSGVTSLIDLSIDSWSSAQEHASVLRATAEGANERRGDMTLRDLLQRSGSRGRISAAGMLGVDVRYAYQFEEEGGRRIVLAAERPLDVEEALDPDAFPFDYDVTVAVIDLDESGRGEGELWLAADITFDADGRVQATGIDVDPIRLGDVRIVE